MVCNLPPSAAWVDPIMQTAEDLDIARNAAAAGIPAYRTPYQSCPICGQSTFSAAGAADCRQHRLWHPPLPESLTWLRCDSCEHVFTDSFYTEAGLKELFRHAHPYQMAGGDCQQQRKLWSPVVESVLRALPGRAKLFDGALSWLDVGCGSGGLVFAAAEFGFAAIGIDLREETVRRLRDLGYSALQADLLSIRSPAPISVISMADLLEHTPYPVAVLRHAHALLDAQGALYLSCPNRECSSWRQMDSRRANPYWSEIEHHHNFSRESLMWLLRQCDFTPVAYSVSDRYIACMEIVAVKAAPSPAEAVKAETEE